jgi:pimeloyl-ACP methyl ester carboxylesterase
MIKNQLSAFLFSLLVLILAVPSVAGAQAGLPEGCGADSLPSHDPKYEPQQLILICIPHNWNGTLVLYAHGFFPPQFELTLPLEELTLEGTFVPLIFLSQGFAFATTSFHKNGAVTQQASRDLNDLVNHFKTLVPRRLLQKVFLIGASEGGLPVMRLIEQQPRRYDGALALCAPIGGALEQIQYAGDFRVVFDYFFPDVFPFGAFDVPPTAFADWESVYVPAISQAMTIDLQNGGSATAQLFNVTGAAVDMSDPTAAIETAIETAIDVLFYSIWETNDLIATTGGMPYDNRSTVYTGSADDPALNAGVERIKGDRRAQNYARRFYQTTGELQRPLVTLHNTLDPVAPFQHELNYADLVEETGSSEFLTVLPVDGYGHCDFTSEQIFEAFALMVQKATAQTLR